MNYIGITGHRGGQEACYTRNGQFAEKYPPANCQGRWTQHGLSGVGKATQKVQRDIFVLRRQ